MQWIINNIATIISLGAVLLTVYQFNASIEENRDLQVEMTYWTKHIEALDSWNRHYANIVNYAEIDDSIGFTQEVMQLTSSWQANSILLDPKEDSLANPYHQKFRELMTKIESDLGSYHDHKAYAKRGFITPGFTVTNKTLQDNQDSLIRLSHNYLIAAKEAMRSDG